MIGPRLELRPAQQLAMTPQLQQAIKLLQMTNLELSRFVDDAVEANPLLHRAEPGADAPPETPPETPPGDPPGDPPAAPSLAAGDPGALSGAFESGSDNVWDPGEPRGGAPGPAALQPGPEAPGPEARIAAEPSLLDHLSAQIGLMRAPAPRRALALALAAEIDEAGYLRLDPAEAAARLGAPAGEMEAAVALLQGCAPTGIGARDLAECLALQLAERDRLDPAMQALLANLPRLARADFGALARICGVDRADLRDMAAELRTLDPRPGRAFAPDAAPIPPPDILVAATPQGGRRVELNPETLPRVLVDNAYAAELAAGGAETRAFVSECRRQAGWLTRSLEQRARSILAVSTEIVRRQDGFFERGVPALRPMTLRQVAEETGLHESSVSRVAAGKLLACERGVFPLRGFFTQALAAADGGQAHSSAAIRARIRALIDAEPANGTLSDDRLTALLQAEGVDIARRTVAKYREGMNIPSSVQRRRLKAAAALP